MDVLFSAAVSRDQLPASDHSPDKPGVLARLIGTVTDLQKSGGDLQVVDKVGVPDGI